MEVSGRVRYTDHTGRFLALAGEAAHQAAVDLVQTAADDARDLAPDGKARKDYGRREKLKPSVQPVMTSAKVGHVVATAGHASSIERGARPHPIPNAFGMGITVQHPGNAEQPYIRPAIRRLRAKADAIVRRAYARLG